MKTKATSVVLQANLLEKYVTICVGVSPRAKHFFSIWSNFAKKKLYLSFLQETGGDI